MTHYILPRLVSVAIDSRLEHAAARRSNVVSMESMIHLSAVLPLPAGWRFRSCAYNPESRNHIAIIEHDRFPRTIDGEAIPKWPVFDVRALSHLTLCDGTRLDG